MPHVECRLVEDARRALRRLLADKTTGLQEEDTQRADEDGYCQQCNAETESPGKFLANLTHGCPPFLILSVWSR